MILDTGIASEIASRVLHASDLGRYIEDQIGRELTEDEGRELDDKLCQAMAEILSEYEFYTEEPQEPRLDPHILWAEEHAGQTFRRPRGTVLYTVTGEAVQFQHGLIRCYVGIEVQRSSDNQKHPMTIADLTKMVRVS